MGKNAWSFALMAAIMAVGVLAQAPSPSSSSSDCTSAITSLSPCLSFVITGSNETKPGNDCCTALSAIVSTKVLCLCQVLSGNNNLGLPINRTQALALPGACNVKTPPISQCAAAGSPIASLTGPASSPLSSPKTAKTPAKAPAASTLAPTKATPAPLSATPALVPAIAPVTSSRPPSAPASSPSGAPPLSGPTVSSLSPPTSPPTTSSIPPTYPPTAAGPGGSTSSSSPPTAAGPGGSTSSSSPPTAAGAGGSTSNLPGAPANSPTTPSAAAIFTPSTLLVLAGVALAYLQC